ncbi:MAG: hypothetical protein JKY37_08145 [Nannocystaceae bacterium]|nr:hypothetical protein [Nannocystaceae bacterium]
MEKSRSQPTHFINVDLDLESRQSLTPFIEHWGDRVFVLRHDGCDDDGWTGGFELEDADRTAEEAILAFIDLVTSLPEQLRERWEALPKRHLDVGIQAGSHPRSWNFSLAPETLARLNEIRVRLVCTVYPASEGTSTHLPKQE